MIYRLKRAFPAFVLIFILITCGEPIDKAAFEEHLMPDTILLNGKIITVDREDSIAEAVAIRDGKIIAVGSTGAIEKIIGRNTQVIDLNGSTATPGLIDSHAHFSGTNLLYVLDLSYPNVKSIKDIRDQIRAQAAQIKPGEWVRGGGWDEGKLDELRHVRASDLDDVAPNNPVWLSHTMGHYGTANSYALKLANITKDTPDPPAGTIDRFPDGAPTGVLKESAQSLVSRLIPGFTREQMKNGLLKIIEEFNREGMTAVKDPGVGDRKWSTYQEIFTEGKLTVRVFGLWGSGKTVESTRRLIDNIGPFTKPYISTGDDLLISGGVKMYLDGSGGARTAWLYEDWNKDYTAIDKENKGYPVIDPDILRKQILMLHNAGIHVSIHAIGDRAIDWVVDSYALALEEKPTFGLRHGIIHCNIPTDHAIRAMAEMQKTYDAAYPEPQASFTWWIGDTYAGNFGPERSLRLNPFKTYLRSGIKWGGGSDYSVTPFAARFGIWASVARKPLKGSYGPNPFGSEESADVRSALRSYTIWNAHQLFLEDKTGSIEVGKYADIAIWDKDMYSIQVDELKNLKCRMTLLAGEIVYKAQDSPITVSKGLRR